MFGRHAKLPIDLTYGTGNQEGESHSVGEYVTSLKTKMSTAFDIVRKCINIMYTRKSSMTKRCMENYLRQGIGYGFTHPWSAEGVAINLNCPYKGPYTVIK